MVRSKLILLASVCLLFSLFSTVCAQPKITVTTDETNYQVRTSVTITVSISPPLGAFICVYVGVAPAISGGVWIVPPYSAGEACNGGGSVR